MVTGNRMGGALARADRSGELAAGVPNGVFETVSSHSNRPRRQAENSPGSERPTRLAGESSPVQAKEVREMATTHEFASPGVIGAVLFR